MSRLRGRTILVAGGTTGIGAAIYHACIAEGAAVICAGRDVAAGEALSRDVGGIFIRTDLSVPAEIERLFEQIAGRGMVLDGAVNNAASSQAAVPIDEMPLDLFDRLVEVNLRGTWLCNAREVGAMRRRGGSIVNVASIAAKRGLAGLSAYCATKHGVVGITRSASLDGAADGIRVNALLPGTTKTKMMEEQMLTRPGGAEGTIAGIPLGRMSEPDEQAKAAVWLLSDDSSYVTGECLTVDGGRTVRT